MGSEMCIRDSSGPSTVAGAVLVDSGDLQLAHVDALQPSDITMQNGATYSFLTDFPEESTSGGSPKIVTLGTGNQTVYVESGHAVIVNDFTTTGSGNLVKDGEGTFSFYDTSNGGTGVLEHTGTTTVLAGQFITVNPAYAPSPSPSPSDDDDDDEDEDCLLYTSPSPRDS